MSHMRPSDEGMPSWTQLVAKVALVALALILITQAGVKGLLVAAMVFGAYIFVRGISRMVDASPKEREARRQERRERLERHRESMQESETHDLDLGHPFARRQLKRDAKRLRKMSIDELTAAAVELLGDDDGSDDSGPPAGV